MRICCTTAPSALPLTKAIGAITQRPRPPHCNTIINVVVLGCGPIPTGDGATALFNGVHNLGEIWPTGGFDTLAKS